MSEEIFSNIEIDTIGEIMNISMGSAATAASTLLDNKVSITTPTVRLVPLKDFEITKLEPAIAVNIRYVEGIAGENILILKKADMRTILSQMLMSNVPEDFTVDAMAESAICELMNQMMGSSATVLSCFLNRAINISTPITIPIDKLEEFKMDHFAGNEQILIIEFGLSIKGMMDTSFISVMQVDLAKDIISASLNFDNETISPENMPTPPAQRQMQAQAGHQSPQGYQNPNQAYAPPYQQQATQPSAQYQQPYAPPVNPIPPQMVQNYNYSDFVQGAPPTHDTPANLDLIMGVPVVVTVELGRTKRKIKEILDFGQGTVVELDKQAGSQVDVIVNGQLIAHGDVVVVDDNFSVRITEILKARDSLTLI